jgi:hypothetical protein
MENTTTTAGETKDLLIRALYSAKAEFKDASANYVTAENNVEDFKRDRSATAADRAEAAEMFDAACKRYDAAEAVYEQTRALCLALGFIN